MPEHGYSRNRAGHRPAGGVTNNAVPTFPLVSAPNAGVTANTRSAGSRPRPIAPIAANDTSDRQSRSVKSTTNAPGSQWAKILRYYHGLRPEQWQAMYDEQDGNCYLCERPLPPSRQHIHIEHDHACCPDNRTCRFCRRGLACFDCNHAIARLGEDPQRMRLVADNLERAKAVTTARLMTKPAQLFMDGTDGVA